MVYFHLNELKFRLIYFLLSYLITFLIFFIYSKELCYLCLKSFLLISNINNFIYTSLEDLIYLYLKSSLIFSLIIIYPFLVYNIYKYISLGLYRQEIYLLKIYVIIILIFIFNIQLLFYYVVIPLLWKILMTYEIIEKYKLFTFNLELIINNYFKLLFLLFNINWLCIILLILLILNNFKNISFILFNKYFNILIFSIFLILLAPPDFILQLCLFIIYIFLVEVYNILLKFLKYFFIFLK